MSMDTLRLKELIGTIAWRIGTLRHGWRGTVLVTGAPRTGTTWVMEILENALGARRLYEPLNWPARPGSSTPFWKSAGGSHLTEKPYLPVDAEHSELETFFNGLLTGRLDRSPIWVTSPNSSRAKRLRHFVLGRTVIKFVRLQRLLPWVLARFSVVCIMIIRHPVATVASQINFALNEMHATPTGIKTGHPVISEQLAARYPGLSRYASTLFHVEEKLAANWCFDYLIPLEQWALCRNTLIVPYESLVTNPEGELRKIEDHLKVRFPQRTLQDMRKPSATAVRDSHVRQGKNPLTTWQSRLSSDEVKRILQVVEQFGIDFYDEGLHPNLEAIAKHLSGHDRPTMTGEIHDQNSTYQT